MRRKTNMENILHRELTNHFFNYTEDIRKDFFYRNLPNVCPIFHFNIHNTHQLNAFKFYMQYLRVTCYKKSEFGPIFALGI